MLCPRSTGLCLRTRLCHRGRLIKLPKPISQNGEKGPQYARIIAEMPSRWRSSRTDKKKPSCGERWRKSVGGFRDAESTSRRHAPPNRDGEIRERGRSAPPRAVDGARTDHRGTGPRSRRSLVRSRNVRGVTVRAHTGRLVVPFVTYSYQSQKDTGERERPEHRRKRRIGGGRVRNQLSASERVTGVESRSIEIRVASE